MINNYHTHTELCRHAGGVVEDYVVEAIRLGMKELGMSDHMPYPDDIHDMRMLYSELDGYIAEINRMKKEHANEISLKMGLECEFNPELIKYYHMLYEEKGMDYLVLGQHFFNKNGKHVGVYADVTSTEEYIDYAEIAMSGMKTGLFSFLCHPDLIFLNDLGLDDNAKRAMDIIIDTSVKNDFILEFNANGLRRGLKQFREGIRYQYPAPFFWEEVSKAKIRTIIGLDAHSVGALSDEAVNQAQQMAKEYGLNVIDIL